MTAVILGYSLQISSGMMPHQPAFLSSNISLSLPVCLLLHGRRCFFQIQGSNPVSRDQLQLLWNALCFISVFSMEVIWQCFKTGYNFFVPTFSQVTFHLTHGPVLLKSFVIELKKQSDCMPSSCLCTRLRISRSLLWVCTDIYASSVHRVHDVSQNAVRTKTKYALEFVTMTGVR